MTIPTNPQQASEIVVYWALRLQKALKAEDDQHDDELEYSKEGLRQAIIDLEDFVGELKLLMPHGEQMTKEELKKENTELKTKLQGQEELSRMQLAAISVASLMNVRKAIKDRLGRKHPYWSVTYEDVCATVDREIKLRERVAGLESGEDEDYPWAISVNLLSKAHDYLLAALDEIIADPKEDPGTKIWASMLATGARAMVKGEE